MSVGTDTGQISAASLRPRGLRRLPIIETLQFAALSGFVIWLALRGAESMGYRWQWYRVPQYIYRVIDGELIWGPLMRGLFVTLELSVWSLLVTVIILSVVLMILESNNLAF